MYYRDAQVALICFDLTNRESFQAVRPWAEELAEKTTGDIQTAIVGNKAGLDDARAISGDEARELAFETGAPHDLECSAKSGEGLMELLMRLVELMPGSRRRRRSPDRAPPCPPEAARAADSKAVQQISAHRNGIRRAVGARCALAQGK
jgi:50S ribosomal subunit-associated GTPase HflX